MFEDSSEDSEIFGDVSIPDTQSAEKTEENELGMTTVSVMETLKLFRRRMRISPAKICRNLC